MKERWKKVKLGEVAECLLGKTINSAKDTGKEYQYLCAINIKFDDIDLSTLKTFKLKDNELERYKVKYGDVLVCEGGDVGRTAIWDKKYNTFYQNALHRIRFKKDVNPRFFLYYMLTKKNNGDLDKIANGVTIKHLTLNTIKKLLIPVPPNSKQQSIVEELDLLNSIISKKKEQLKELDNLAQATFHDMFGDPIENEKGWEVKTLNDVCNKITDGTHNPPKFIENKSSNSIPFIVISCIKENKLTFNTEKFITKEDYIKLQKRAPVEKGDVLYTSVGSYGNPAIVDTKRAFSFQRHIALLKPNFNLINSQFLHSYLASKEVRHEADKYAIGIAQKTLNLSSIKKMKIILPSLPLQQAFADKVTVIENMKTDITRSITDTQQQLDATMDKYFG